MLKISEQQAFDSLYDKTISSQKLFIQGSEASRPLISIKKNGLLSPSLHTDKPGALALAVTLLWLKVTGLPSIGFIDMLHISYILLSQSESLQMKPYCRLTRTRILICIICSSKFE